MSNNFVATMRYGQANIPALNILGVADPGGSSVAGMAERLFYAAFNSYMSLTGDSTKLLSVKLVDADGSAEAEFTNPGNTTQNPNANDLPINNAFLVSKSFFGTVRKGRLFIPGVPPALYILVTPIEFVTVFLVRPLTLAVRLTANMIAGHLMLAIFFVGTWYLQWKLVTIPFAAMSFALGTFILAFELLVGVLQAYIFTILTAVYIAGAIHPEH